MSLHVSRRTQLVQSRSLHKHVYVLVFFFFFFKDVKLALGRANGTGMVLLIAPHTVLLICWLPAVLLAFTNSLDLNRLDTEIWIIFLTDSLVNGILTFTSCTILTILYYSVYCTQIINMSHFFCLWQKWFSLFFFNHTKTEPITFSA